jgi:hypothetical protein
MSYQLTIGQVILGGNGADNPVPLTQANYQLSASEAAQSLMNYNVIGSMQTVSYEVTGLVLFDPATGRPKLGVNDPVYMPCPPFCK